MASDITLNAGAGGAIIRTDPTSSSEHFQLVKLAYGDTGTFNFVSTALPLPGLVTYSSTPTVLSASSGLIQLTSAIALSSGIVTLSSVPTVTATAATNPWSSAPGFNVPMVSASSGLISLTSAISLSSGIVSMSSVQVINSASSGFVQALFPVNSSAGFGPVTSSAGQLVTISSGVVTLSSATSLSSGTVTLSSATSLSSGTVTLSSNPTVISASSGFVQALFPINSSAGFGPVTSSAGILANITSGTITLSSATSLSSGTVTLSSAPLVQSASSGVVQALAYGTVTSSGQSMFLFYTTGAVTVQNITTAASNLKSYLLFNSSVAEFAVKIYNTTGPTAGSTTGMVLAIAVPGSTGGGGANFGWSAGPFSSNGWSIVPTLSINATSTDAPSSNHPLNFTYQV